ncbi:MAG: ketopantoate reductase family protein [Hyphomicrobium sp.]
MKLLFLGAGAVGGFFGGRLAAADADVTFLVRPRRAGQLARDGLILQDPSETIKTPAKTITSDRAEPDYDVVALSPKAYDLASAINAIRPAVGPDTRVLPLLNGLRHLDDLDAAFGTERVLGGTCHVSATMTPDGVIRRFSDFAALTQGPRTPSQSAICTNLHTTLSRGGFEARLSDDVIGAMWEKWVLLATLAGMTCLMRANIGEIVATEAGAGLISAMLDECCAVAAASGHRPRGPVIAASRATLTDPKSDISASMRRDIERGARTESDNILGDLIARAESLGIPTPLLAVANAHLQAYEARLDAAAKTE